MNKRKAVFFFEGRKFTVCCDVLFEKEFNAYYERNQEHKEEIEFIFRLIHEGLAHPKFAQEKYGTWAMKPFKNQKNDRIICQPVKRPSKKMAIVMAELFERKKTQGINKVLDKRYKIVSKYEYEIKE